MKFSELNLKNPIKSVEINFNGAKITVYQNLSTIEKGTLIEDVLALSYEEDGWYNPIKLDCFFNMEILLHYTDIEMDEEDLRSCLITTVINNREFQDLHGVYITKPEKEIVLGVYHDKKGEIIRRKISFWTSATYAAKRTSFLVFPSFDKKPSNNTFVSLMPR